MDLVKGVLGTEGSYELKFEGGKVVLSLVHKHASGDIGLVVKEDAEYFIDQLAKAIPGTFDDKLLELLKGAVKAL